jgi:antitoxin HicB
MRHDTERRELEYYLNLRYPVTVHPDPESGFVAEIEELPGCMTQAETLDEIFKVIEDARQLWIETAYNEGQDIPLPRDMEKHTGKFLVRIPRGLHRDLARAAKREGVSLNQYVTSLLAAGASRDMGTLVGTMMRFIWAPPPSARIWGTDKEVLDFWELTSKPQSKVIEVKR